MTSLSRAVRPIALFVCQLTCWAVVPAPAQETEWTVTDGSPPAADYAAEPEAAAQWTSEFGLLPMAIEEEAPTSLAEYATSNFAESPTLADHMIGVLGSPSWDAGVGQEWIAVSPFQIDTAQPMNNMRLRFVAGFNQQFPDRAEYFWAKRASLVGERSVDYQDFRWQTEIGTDKFSVSTELPIRAVDPVLNQNVAGLGDMTLATKTVMFEGRQWQVTQIFKTYFNTGSPTGGLGTGHISLEPGLLVRYDRNPIMDWHAELKFWFPLGADPNHSGEVLQYGLGVTRLHHDDDAFAILSAWELVAWSVLDGKQTIPGLTVTEDIDGMGILHFYPGLRFVFDRGGDWGVWDFGVGGGFGLTDDRWYDGILRVDLRWKQ